VSDPATFLEEAPEFLVLHVGAHEVTLRAIDPLPLDLKAHRRPLKTPPHPRLKLPEQQPCPRRRKVADSAHKGQPIWVQAASSVPAARRGPRYWHVSGQVGISIQGVPAACAGPRRKR
jgi:hypothetical protein